MASPQIYAFFCSWFEVLRLMEWVNNYLFTRYENHGRGPDVFDCWGLVRDVLHKHFSTPLLDSYGLIHPDNKSEMTRGYDREVKQFSSCNACSGAVIAGFRGDHLIHVGVCVTPLKVLHTSRSRGPSLDSLRSFTRQFTRVEFYKYVGSY